MIDIAGTIYEMPYQRLATPPKDVLIVGAGNGNDVAAALAAGAEHVDAVEIDPRAAGPRRRRITPTHPYDDPRVTRITNDGRAYLQQTDKKYDLIIFALPDSLTLVSGQSAVRLESFLFTKEAMEAARDHLNPDGAFSMYNFYREPWLLDRLAGGLERGLRPRAMPRSAARRARRRSATFSMLTVGIDPADTRLRRDVDRRAARWSAGDRRPAVRLPEDAVDPVAVPVDPRPDPDRLGAGRAPRRGPVRRDARLPRPVLHGRRASCCSRPSPWCSSRCCSARRGS